MSDTDPESTLEIASKELNVLIDELNEKQNACVKEEALQDHHMH